MGLFTEDIKVKPLPRTEASHEAESYLATLMRRRPTVPTQGVAGLTPAQLLIQSMLPETVSGVTGAADVASDYYRSLLSDQYDVFSDPRYEALRLQAEQNARAAETAAKRAGEAGGMLKSSGTQQKVYRDVAATQSPLLAAIGDLLTNREQQRLQAAQGVQTAEAQRLSSLAGISNIADLQRTIEQMQADALYRQALQQIMFPYQYNAQIAQALLNYQEPYYVAGGGLKDWAAGMAVLSPMLSSAITGLAKTPTTQPNLGQNATGYHVP